jgi:hypothetical protein
MFHSTTARADICLSGSSSAHSGLDVPRHGGQLAVSHQPVPSRPCQQCLGFNVSFCRDELRLRQRYLWLRADALRERFPTVSAAAVFRIAESSQFTWQSFAHWHCDLNTDIEWDPNEWVDDLLPLLWWILAIQLPCQREQLKQQYDYYHPDRDYCCLLSGRCGGSSLVLVLLREVSSSQSGLEAQ